MHRRIAFVVDSFRSVVAPPRLRLRGRRRRRALWPGYFFSALLATAAAVHATSVTPPSFPELVAEADVIARGTVRAIRADWADSPNGRVIKTYVTFAIEQRLKGDAADTVTLEFLGGSVGGDSLRVSGMPRFAVGDHEIVFIRGNGAQFCPLVRMMHGRYRVRVDAASGRRYVARDDEAPLSSIADVQRAADDHAPRVAALHNPAASLTPEDFESQIAAEVARRR